MLTQAKPTLAVWKFASCDGCQLSLLDCETEILALGGAVDIRYFPEASSRMEPGPYDLSLVEGSITTDKDRERIKEVRRQSRVLVCIGACATAGGIQALRNYRNVSEMLRVVYAEPSYIDTLSESTPISDHVRVDFELRGCPISKAQLLEVISAFLQQRKPAISSSSVCLECKARGTVCVMVAEGTACLGPITHAGCGALCPSYRRGCFGCYGASESASVGPLEVRLHALGLSSDDTQRLLLGFTPADPVFSRPRGGGNE